MREWVRMTMFARQFTVRAAGALIMGSLLVGSGVRGYQALGKGAHPAAIVSQPAREEFEPAKAATDDPARTTLRWVDSMQQLAKIGSAINGFHKATGFLPPAAIREPKTGKPLLSWRVAILPWMGSRDLYKQFHLDEAWDSPHNKALLAKMPYEYAPLGHKPKEPFTTFYQAFVGPGTAFEPLPNKGKLRLSNIHDGAAITLAVVDAGSAVPWTKPEDLPFQLDQPLPPVGGSFKDGFNLVCLDGSVFSVARSFDERLLKALITRDGGEPIDIDQLHQIPVLQQPVRAPVTFLAHGGKVQVKKAAEPPAKSPAALAQLEVAKKAFAAIAEMQSRGVPVPVEVHRKWSLRLLDAERAISTTKAEEVAALEAYCTRMKELKERSLTLYKAAQVSFLQCLDTEYLYNEAVAWLQKAKTEAADPSR